MGRLLSEYRWIMIVVIAITVWAWARTGETALKIDDADYNAAWKTYIARDKNQEPALSYQYEDCFRKAAQDNALPYSLLLAVARGESFFNPEAISKKSCYGIMQIQWPGTAKDLGIDSLTDLLDPCKNIAAGAAYLRRLMDRYDGNVHLTLAAYNYGPGAIGKNPSVDDIPRGARWYSGYIHHHLQKILEGARSIHSVSSTGATLAIRSGASEKKKEIIAFNRPYRAMGFYDTIQKRAPSIRLDWFRSGPGRFQVVLLYSNDDELVQGIAVLKQLGFTLRQ